MLNDTIRNDLIYFLVCGRKCARIYSFVVRSSFPIVPEVVLIGVTFETRNKL